MAGSYLRALCVLTHSHNYFMYMLLLFSSWWQGLDLDASSSFIGHVLYSFLSVSTGSRVIPSRFEFQPHHLQLVNNLSRLP